MSHWFAYIGEVVYSGKLEKIKFISWDENICEALGEFYFFGYYIISFISRAADNKSYWSSTSTKYRHYHQLCWHNLPA